MPEDSKKNKGKPKDGPKDQRKPRPSHNIGAVKAPAVKPEASKVPVHTEPAKPVQAPEFHNSRNEDVLKISEEANSKYKKKEIVSNRAKYETEIETYEEMEEKAEMGADYAKLIDASSSIGGHFQFKHEKSWDINTGPSLYDKYFDINMEKLADALNTIPFYQRNDLDKSLFTEGDIINMDNKATRGQQKYYKDKSFTNSEIAAQKTILDSFTNNEDIATRPEKPKFQYTRLDDLDSQNQELSVEPENTSKVELPSSSETGQYEYTVVENVAKTVEEISKAPETNARASGNPAIQSPEELEKWLDDLLEG